MKFKATFESLSLVDYEIDLQAFSWADAIVMSQFWINQGIASITLTRLKSLEVLET